MMVSPSDKKRRHVKQNYKGRKKNLNYEETRKQRDPLPRITRGRLTTKGGFSFRGAVLTAPYSRCQAGLSKQKPKKGLPEFDLENLLKAAKSKDVPDQDHSSSGSSSMSGGSSNEFVDSYEHKTKKIKLYEKSNHTFKSFKTKTESQSSSENQSKMLRLNNKRSTGNMSQVFELKNNSGHDDFDAMDQEGPHHGSASLQDHLSDRTKSSNNFVPLLRSKPCSLSAYQKFAAGITEALTFEKKKQFPNQNWLHDIEVYINNIYDKNHKPTQSRNQLKVVVHEQNTTRSHLTDSSGDARMGLNEVLKHVTVENTEISVESGVPQNAQEEKMFKQRSVEAWVKSIPINIEGNNRIKYRRDSSLKSANHLSCLPTEKFLLRDIKKISCAPKTSHPNFFKIMGNGLSTSCYGVQSSQPPQEVASPGEHNPNVTQRGQTKKKRYTRETNFPYLDEGLSGFQEINSIDNNEDQPWSPLCLFQYKPDKYLQSTWIPWCKGNKEKYASGRDVLQRTDNISPSPAFCFDPFSTKSSKASLERLHDERHSGTKDSDGSSVWFKFPKLMKCDKSKRQKNIFPKPKEDQNIERAKSLVNIDLSPRKVF